MPDTLNDGDHPHIFQPGSRARELLGKNVTSVSVLERN
jgi:hypothetical protein